MFIEDFRIFDISIFFQTGPFLVAVFGYLVYIGFSETVTETHFEIGVVALSQYFP